MIKISKKAQYGLRAVVLLAKNYRAKRILSVREMANIEQIPFEFLEKIILQMEKADLVLGKKGAQGGYVLSKNPNKMTVKDIVSVLEGQQKTVDCSFCQRSKNCLTKSVWSKVTVELNKTLQGITLADLIK